MLFTSVVATGLPFHKTSDDWTKLEPFTVNMKLGPFNNAVTGEIDETTGTGVEGGEAGGLCQRSVLLAAPDGW